MLNTIDDYFDFLEREGDLQKEQMQKWWDNLQLRFEDSIGNIAAANAAGVDPILPLLLNDS